MSVQIHFFVEGRPQTAGSKTSIPIKQDGRITGSVVVDSGDRPAKRAWREDCREAARTALWAASTSVQPWSMEGPFAVEFVFHRRRPKAHYGTGRNATTLKPSAPEHPTTRPDALKMARAVEDALTGIVWHDDAAIVDEQLKKAYGEREGVAVTVRVLLPAGSLQLEGMAA